MIPAFYDQKVRSALDNAVRPTAIEIAKQLESGDWTEASVESVFPKTEGEYFKDVLDVKVLPGAQ
jgi:hypothetical protein